MRSPWKSGSYKVVKLEMEIDTEILKMESDLGSVMARMDFRDQGEKVGIRRLVMGAVSDFLEIQATGMQSRAISCLEVRISGRSRIARGREINLKSEMCVR